MCVCVEERERGGGREREREGVRESKNTCLYVFERDQKL